jgi:hypothetical protein
MPNTANASAQVETLSFADLKIYFDAWSDSKRHCVAEMNFG